MKSFEEIIQLTEDLFNYYNGKINPNFPAILNIEFIRNPKNRIFGNFMYPNIVNVYPLSIYFTNTDLSEEVRLFYLVDTVIHELYHAEQLGAWNVPAIRMGERKRKNMLEAHVRFMTSAYILNHKQEIWSLFHISLEHERINNILNFRLIRDSQFNQYQRKRYLDQIHASIVSVISRLGKKAIKDVPTILGKLQKYEEDIGSCIIFVINDTKICIKQYRQWITIQEFNNLVYQALYSYPNIGNITYALLENEEINSVVFVLLFDIENNNMAHIVKKEN